MDLSNGRSAHLKALVYSDATSGYEILSIEQGGVLKGVVYHPKKFSIPVVWSDDCTHCRLGQKSAMNIHLKRLVQLLCSQDRSEDGLSFIVPTNIQPYHLSCKHDNDGWIVKAKRVGSEEVLDVIARTGEKVLYSKKLREFQSRLLHRCLRLLFTARVPTDTELSAILKPLADSQAKNGYKAWARSPCLRIDWLAILNPGEKEISHGKQRASSSGSRKSRLRSGRK
jgi:hypothetical protein